MILQLRRNQFSPMAIHSLESRLFILEQVLVHSCGPPGMLIRKRQLLFLEEKFGRIWSGRRSVLQSKLRLGSWGKGQRSFSGQVLLLALFWGDSSEHNFGS